VESAWRHSSAKKRMTVGEKRVVGLEQLRLQQEDEEFL
jgi:hypothetical protein